MSRSRKRNVSSSPVQRYIEYKTGSGKFSYYDKDKSKDVELDKLTIILLDERSSITGWFERNDKGTNISSNVIQDITGDTLVVRANKNKHFAKSEVIYEGVYDRDKIKGLGGKFTTNVYCLVDLGNGYEIANLQIKGYGLKSWNDIKDATEFKNEGIYDYEITLQKGEKKKKGASTFYGIEYTTSDLSETNSVLATEKDEVLANYFDSASPSTEVEPESESSTAESPSAPDEEDKDDLPF